MRTAYGPTSTSTAFDAFAMTLNLAANCPFARLQAGGCPIGQGFLRPSAAIVGPDESNVSEEIMYTGVDEARTTEPVRAAPTRSIVDVAHRLLPVARVVVPLLLLALLVKRLGAAAFRPALGVLSPLPLVAALVLGGLAIAAQSA